MTDVTVTRESRTYEQGGPHSYFADLVLAEMPSHPGARKAAGRLGCHSAEMVAEARHDTAAGRRVRRSIMETQRSVDGISEQSMRRELRGLSTSIGSAGAFAAPSYLVDDAAPYRTYGRAFVDQTTLRPLPETGMQVVVPAVTGPAGAATSAENAAVAETDPPAVNVTVPVLTASGQVTASQALIDRQTDASADTAIWAQLDAAFGTNLDSQVLAAALATAGTVTNTGSLSITNFWRDVARAQSQMITAAGSVLPATHTFFPPLEWAWLTGQVDSEGRPIILPAYSPTPTASDPTTLPEGDCGYVIVGTAAFRDGNIPLAGGNAQLVVASAPNVEVWEGAPMYRALVEPGAGTLSVTLQRYSYYAVNVRHAGGSVIAVSGAAYPATPIL